MFSSLPDPHLIKIPSLPSFKKKKSLNTIPIKTDSQITQEIYTLLKKSRSDNLWKTPLINNKISPFQNINNQLLNSLDNSSNTNSLSLLKKEQELYKSQKKHYHSYLSGDQKFDRKFLLKTYFEIEANERNLQQNIKKTARKLSETNHQNQIIDQITTNLQAIKQKSLEEDLKAFGQISNTAFYQFSEKLSLYNDYSTTFIVEPKNLTPGFLKLKKFRLYNFKKSMPMSAYVRRIKTLYNREGESMSPNIRNPDEAESFSPIVKRTNNLFEDQEEKEGRLKKTVIEAFSITKKRKVDKEKEAFLKSKKDLSDKEKSLRKVIANLKEKNKLTNQEKQLLSLMKMKKHEEILHFLHKNPKFVNIKDELKNSLLHWAIKTSVSLNFIQELLALGADFQARDFLDRTPKELANKLKKTNIEKTLMNFEEKAQKRPK